MSGMQNLIDWLLTCDEPWTRYRARLDLLGCSPEDDQVQADREAMLAHPQVRGLIERAAQLDSLPFKRHNDAAYPLYALSTLADFGLQAPDPGLDGVVRQVLAHASPEGPLRSLVNVPRVFGGTGEDGWVWMACDAPTLLYALLALGVGDVPDVQRAAAHLVGLAQDNGYRCTASPELGRFHGPGKRSDPCPIANVYALKALALIPGGLADPAVRLAAERAAGMLLDHWQHRQKVKYYLFGMGTDFAKLKYPLVWYDLLHVVEVLSRFSFVYADPRFRELLDLLVGQAGPDGRYTAGSMYQSWKGWSFADKKRPSPWLTLVVRRIVKRVDESRF